MPHIRPLAASFALLLAGCGASAVVSVSPRSIVCPGSGYAVATAIDEDSELLRVERLFSHGSDAQGPAPRVWSSRLNIRWTARWQTAPRYAV